MPQLDKVTFLSQFFWLSFFFIFFYFLLLKFFLPKMNLILKLRKNKLSGSIDNVNSLHTENKKIYHNYETLLYNALLYSKNAFNKSFSGIHTWLQKNVDNTEKKHYTFLNKNYIQYVCENSFSQNLALYIFNTQIHKNIFIFSLLNTLKNKK